MQLLTTTHYAMQRPPAREKAGEVADSVRPRPMLYHPCTPLDTIHVCTYNRLQRKNKKRPHPPRVVFSMIRTVDKRGNQMGTKPTGYYDAHYIEEQDLAAFIAAIDGRLVGTSPAKQWPDGSEWQPERREYITGKGLIELARYAPTTDDEYPTTPAGCWHVYPMSPTAGTLAKSQSMVKIMSLAYWAGVDADKRWVERYNKLHPEPAEPEIIEQQSLF